MRANLPSSSIPGMFLFTLVLFAANRWKHVYFSEFSRSMFNSAVIQLDRGDKTYPAGGTLRGTVLLENEKDVQLDGNISREIINIC